MEPKNPMEVLTDADLMAEFKMNKNFISRHSKQMGSRGRPRSFMRVNVERFVTVYYNDQLMEELEKKAKAIRAEEAFAALSRPSFSAGPVSPRGLGKMILRGGRQKGVAA